MGRFENLKFVPGLNIDRGWDLKIGGVILKVASGHSKNIKIGANDSQHDFRYFPAQN